MGNSGSYPSRFFLQFCREVRAVTKPERVFLGLVSLAGLFFQYLRGGLSLTSLRDVGTAFLFSALWGACSFGCWLAIKTARVLHTEDMEEYRQYKPVLAYVGDP